MNIEILSAYERGLDDGFFRGERVNISLNKSDDERIAYKCGYDHGVWMYTETYEQES